MNNENNKHDNDTQSTKENKWALNIALIVCVLIIAGLIYGNIQSNKMSKLIETKNEGRVIEKSVEETGCFNTTKIQYELKLAVKFVQDENGQYEKIKTIPVSEITYFTTEIGDYIDDISQIQLK